MSAASVGGIYAQELLDSVALNLHRIDKDVQRCDRNYTYFTNAGNLDKLRNVMCTYVWEHLEVGYVQGMCDLVAPLLVILDDGKCNCKRAIHCSLAAATKTQCYRNYCGMQDWGILLIFFFSYILHIIAGMYEVQKHEGTFEYVPWDFNILSYMESHTWWSAQPVGIVHTAFCCDDWWVIVIQQCCE